MAESRMLTARIDTELYELVSDYAGRHCNGNVSKAVSQLISLGLDSDGLSSQFASKIEKVFDEQMDRMAKIASRGTKASLANLILASTFLPVAAMSSIESAKKSNPSDEVDFLESQVSKWTGCSQSDAFDFAWTAGGRLQASGSKADYSSAIKGLKTRVTNYDFSDLWEV